jgi:hypothetical protein
MAYINPSVADFKARFIRDFPFGTNINTSVTDTDVANAFGLTNFNLNQALFAIQADYTSGYLLLAAHYLVMNLRASSQGINGQFAWLEISKGVGSVNASFSIPQMILDNPYWAMFSKTNYGMLYLNLLQPQLVGVVRIACGSTRP